MRMENRLDSYRRTLSEFIIAGKDANPINLIRYFDKVGVNQDGYRELAKELEQEILKLVPLLEKYQLLLRGDSISDMATEQSPAIFKETLGTKFDVWTTLPSVRNAKRKLGILETKLKSLGGLAASLFRVNTIARNRKEVDTTPLIVYGFGDSFEEEDYPQGAYFYGLTKDRGPSFQNAKAIVLPKNYKDKSGQEVDVNNDLFPTVRSSDPHKPSFDPTSEDLQRIGRFNVQEDPVIYEQVLSVPKTYFNLLALVHKILCDVEKFDMDEKRRKRKDV